MGAGWLCTHHSPSPLLLSRARAVLGGSPDLLMPRGFQSHLHVLTWVPREVSHHPDQPWGCTLPQEWASPQRGPSVSSILWVPSSGSHPQLQFFHTNMHTEFSLSSLRNPACETWTQVYLVLLTPGSNEDWPCEGQTCCLPDRPKDGHPGPRHTSPCAGSSRVEKPQRTGGWGAPVGTTLCIMPVDLYMTPLIL